MANGSFGAFFGLDAATLQALLNSYLACLTAIATAGQEYTISGRTFTRADLAEVKAMVRDLKQALDYANGTRLTSAFPMFTGPYRR